MLPKRVAPRPDLISIPFMSGMRGENDSASERLICFGEELESREPLTLELPEPSEENCSEDMLAHGLMSAPWQHADAASKASL